MKNVLVTGGSGFIGSNLTLEIQKQFPKANITVLDDFRGGAQFKTLLGYRGDFMAFSAADRSWLSLWKNRSLDVIFHLASITDTTIHDQQKMMIDNVEGFRNILELASDKKATVVYASSAAVYGNQASSIKEEHAGFPNNIYGFSKWVLDNIARQYDPEIRIVGLRYFNVFGPGEYYKGAAASMIYQLALQMMSGKRPRIFKAGEQRRDFIYVKDVVRGTMMARGAKENTVVNIGTGQATSFNEVIQSINEALGTHLEPEYFENPYSFYQNFTQADMSHTEKAIGFKPEYTTRDGIRDYVLNYLRDKK